MHLSYIAPPARDDTRDSCPRRRPALCRVVSSWRVRTRVARTPYKLLPHTRVRACDQPRSQAHSSCSTAITEIAILPTTSTIINVHYLSDTVVIISHNDCTPVHRCQPACITAPLGPPASPHRPDLVCQSTSRRVSPTECVYVRTVRRSVTPYHTATRSPQT